jgi:hypothetical protein
MKLWNWKMYFLKMSVQLFVWEKIVLLFTNFKYLICWRFWRKIWRFSYSYSPSSSSLSFFICLSLCTLLIYVCLNQGLFFVSTVSVLSLYGVCLSLCHCLFYVSTLYIFFIFLSILLYVCLSQSLFYLSIFLATHISLLISVFDTNVYQFISVLSLYHCLVYVLSYCAYLSIVSVFLPSIIVCFMFLSFFQYILYVLLIFFHLFHPNVVL